MLLTLSQGYHEKEHRTGQPRGFPMKGRTCKPLKPCRAPFHAFSLAPTNVLPSGHEAMKELRTAAKSRGMGLNDLLFADTQDVLLPAGEVWDVCQQLQGLTSAAEKGSVDEGGSPFAVHNLRGWVTSLGNLLGDWDHPALDPSHLGCVDQLRHHMVFLKSLAHHGKAKVSHCEYLWSLHLGEISESL
ncbi:hypothetical protein DUNSADRAFT_5629 [Dunaliella salina]|uniref:Uncharacterized protein n=1 Tax=Dunaliella salina TaxID=3046 RepID=A0ABQ7FU63_DUNSA|nr:hypothetical protein DUNSADRAFT_5629 [Dunaliella salina]|eukprot:KAF5825967.1 hypothetical protein DUNSADRAFT_5629 [Dunaliella salina]